MKPTKETIDFFKDLSASAMFMSIHSYQNSQKELSNITIITHLDYKRIVQESLEKLNEITSVKVGDKVYTVSDPEFQKAYGELWVSLEKSLVGENEKGNAINEHYINISKNVKMHKETGELYIDGKILKKNIIEKGEYREVKSRLNTLIKNAIRKELPVSQWKRYKITKEHCESLIACGTILTPENLYEE